MRERDTGQMLVLDELQERDDSPWLLTQVHVQLETGSVERLRYGSEGSRPIDQPASVGHAVRCKLPSSLTEEKPLTNSPRSMLDKWEILGAVAVWRAYGGLTRKKEEESKGCRHVQGRLWHGRDELGFLGPGCAVLCLWPPRRRGERKDSCRRDCYGGPTAKDEEEGGARVNRMSRGRCGGSRGYGTSVLLLILWTKKIFFFELIDAR